ncbi:MAG: hypothetical protein ACJ760_05035 [Thermoleophilaceae bacterium]
MVKAIAALVPLEQLAGRTGSAGAGRGAGWAAHEPSGTVHQTAAKRHRHTTTGHGAAAGPLPFTGLALLTLLLAGTALLLLGAPLRRATGARTRTHARETPPASQPQVAPALPAVRGPAALVRVHQGGHAPARVVGLAVLGMVGLAVLARHRRA